MNESIKKAIKELTPPILIRALTSTLKGKGAIQVRCEEQGEKAADWYDASFESRDHWKQHYSLSPYYFLWTVIADRMIRLGLESVLEIGCGPGQLACLLRDKGIKKYCGFDFSPKRVEQAKKVCPELKFSEEDVFKTKLFTEQEYATVVCTEFLEHVEEDIAALKKIRPKVTFFGTVPNFPYISHVRHFENEAQVLARYGECFETLRVDSFLGDDHGKTFFLMEGIIK